MLLTVLACSSSSPSPLDDRPTGIPAGAAKIHYKGNDVLVNDTVVDTSRSLSLDASGPHDALFEALRKHADGPGTWVALPSNATWSEARRSLHTALEANAGPVWYAPAGRADAIGPLANDADHTRPILSCDAKGLPLTGVGYRVSFEVQMEASVRWVSPALRFLPRVKTSTGETLAELLPTSCWREASCEILADAVAKSACESAKTTAATPVSRVVVGGPNGCIVPIANGEARWSEPLSPALNALGIPADAPFMVMADEPIPFGDVMQLLDGLKKHGTPQPKIGLLNMGSGESVPTCDNPIRTRDDVSRATGTWLGSMLAQRTAETPDD